jgi:hypothetical protein
MTIRTTALLLIATVLPTLGCLEPYEQCIRDFAADKGYGYDNDEWNFACGVPEGCDPVTPEVVQQWCIDDNHECDAAEFITRDAALCIAETQALEPGITDWYANLTYSYRFKEPVWQVVSITAEDADGTEVAGWILTIDAVTGGFLVLDEWGAEE